MSALTAQTATITLPYLPHSLNADMYAHWAVRRKHKQQLQADIEALLMAERLPRPIAGGLGVHYTFVVPDKRRRDLDNLLGPAMKATGDALTRGGWLADDTPEHLTLDGARFEHEKGVRATRITLTW